MNAKNIQIKAKKISELENLEDERIINDSYVVVSYTENGSKENYKLQLKKLLNNVHIEKPETEYSLNIFTNGVILLRQSPGPYYKDTIITLEFKAMEQYELTDSSPFVSNCTISSWNKNSGKLTIKVSGTGNPIINISAASLLTYIINYSGLQFIDVYTNKLIYRKNDIINLNLTPHEGYILPNNSNAFNVEGGSIISYNNIDGLLRIKVNNNVIISGSAIERPKYNINVNIPNASIRYTPNKEFYYKDDIVYLTITPNVGYNAPNLLFTTNCELISYENNIATIKITGEGNVSINGTCILKSYTLNVNLTNVTITKNPEKASYNYGDEITFNITPNEGYNMPIRSNISISGGDIKSYNNGVLKILVKNNVTLNITASQPAIIEKYYFGMTYTGEGYFETNQAILRDNSLLYYFNGNITNLNSEYISYTQNVSPIPYSGFDMDRTYPNVKIIGESENIIKFTAIILPTKYVIAQSNGSYLFTDDNGNQYEFQKTLGNINNFEYLKTMYNDLINESLNIEFNWAPTVNINGISHTLLYFKDAGTGGEYIFKKIN